MLTFRMHLGSALVVLAAMPDASVDCIVTSPPYWGLRDYGTGRWEGGDPNCEHRGRAKPRQDTSGSTKRFSDSRGQQPSKRAFEIPVRDECGCGARRVDEQIGLESSPHEFVDALVAVFREARRVLRDEGVLWLNMGDCYANDGKWGGETGGKHEYLPDADRLRNGRERRVTGLKPKDLVGIPWRLAFALQDDGWYLRSDVIWHKPNPMPESVKDRPTKAHEYVFLLSKSPRYWYDADAIREKYAETTLKQFAAGYNGSATRDYAGAGVQNPSGIKARIVAAGKKQDGHDNRQYTGFNKRWDDAVLVGDAARGANARTVWSIITEPSPFDHFAVMPRALARRCIMVGCPVGGTVLDPFAGSGTTGVVALEEGRNFVGVELSPKYYAMARERLASVAPLLASEVHPEVSAPPFPSPAMDAFVSGGRR